MLHRSNRTNQTVTHSSGFVCELTACVMNATGASILRLDNQVPYQDGSDAVQGILQARPASGGGDGFDGNQAPWGNVCSDMSSETAEVACRQMGYASGIVLRDQSPTDSGVGEALIWFDSLNCQGIEDDISHCTDGWGFGECEATAPAAIACIGGGESSPLLALAIVISMRTASQACALPISLSSMAAAAY